MPILDTIDRLGVGKRVVIPVESEMPKDIQAQFDYLTKEYGHLGTFEISSYYVTNDRVSFNSGANEFKVTIDGKWFNLMGKVKPGDGSYIRVEGAKKNFNDLKLAIKMFFVLLPKK